MNVRVLVAFVLVVIFPIAIGLYWIAANDKDFTLFEYAAFLLFATTFCIILHAIASAQKRRWREDIKREWERDITDFQRRIGKTYCFLLDRL